MNDVDIEIEALEELINLQKKKVDLLRRKRLQDTDAEPCKADKDTTTKDNGVELNTRRGSRASRSGKSESTSVLESVANAINAAMHEDDGSQEEEEEDDRFDETTAPVPMSMDSTSKDHDEKGRNTFSMWWSKKESASQQKEERFVDALTRLSRLTTDLANERTYLAWIRTALASARTVVSFLALSGTNQLGRVSARTCVISFAVLALFMMFQGTERYRKIKQILLTKDTPAGFARLTTLPISLALLAVLGLVVLVTSTDDWVN